MDDFFEYWELIPENEKYEQIGQEIVRYKRNLSDTDISSRDLSDQVISFFQSQLIISPYPIYEIIYHIFDFQNCEKNQLLEEIILNAVITFIDLLIAHPEQLDKKFKLLCLLSNISISQHGLPKIQDVIIPALFDLKENRKLLDDVLYFALLSRNSVDFLNLYLNYEQTRLMKNFDLKSFYLKCHHQKKHWIDQVLDRKNDEQMKKSFNSTLANYIVLYRIILNGTNQKNIFDTDVCQLDFNFIDPTVITNEVLNLCYIELLRQSEINKFLKSQNIHSKYSIDMTKNHLMTQLLSHQINFKIDEYEKILDVIQKNYELTLSQITKFHRANEMPEKTEMQLLNEYMIIKLYLSNILQSTHSSCDSTIDECFNHIRGLFKTINDGSVVLRLIQIILTLIFVRFEHIKKTRLKKRGSEISGSTSNYNNSLNSTDISDNVFIDVHRNGFICSKECLKGILNSLRLFLSSLDITEAYKNSNAELKEKFTSLLKIVDNAIWRLRLVEDQSPAENVTNGIQESREWINFYGSDSKSFKKIAEDERSDSKRKVFRKKSRKGSRKCFKSDDNDEDSENQLFITEATLTEHSEVRMKSLEARKRNNEIIKKMLLKPESLLAICAIRNDDENVQKIIKEYSLQESEIAQKVQFIKNYQEVLFACETIIDKYRTVHPSEMEGADAKVGEIKSVAETGFEVAKLLDILEKFTNNYNTSPLEKNEFFIEKMISHHSGLWVYANSSLHMAVLLDILISLKSPFELMFSIYKFITKEPSSTQQADKNSFYFTFLNRVMEIMIILKNQESIMTISELLNQEIFSLDPELFKKQYENRHEAINMMKINTQILNEDESRVQEIAEKIQRFDSETKYFSRLLNYVRNVRLILKFKTNDVQSISEVMTELNIFDVIGNIVFINQYNPVHLANFAFNANINLLHSIAIAAAGEISPHYDKEDEKCLSLFYLDQMSHQESNFKEYQRQSTTFKITNTDILYYIKREGSFMVAYLLKEIQKFDYKSLKYDETNYLDRMKKLDITRILKTIYDENEVLAILNYDHVNLISLFLKIQTLELNERLGMLNCVTEKNWQKNRVQFNELKDFYIEKLIERDPSNLIKLLTQIESVTKFSEILLKHAHEIKSDSEFKRLLRWCLNNESVKEIGNENHEKLTNWMVKLRIYQQILQLFKDDESSEKNIDWLNIMELAETSTVVLVNYLLNISVNLELCYDLLKIHPLTVCTDEAPKILIEALNRKGLNHQHNMLFKIIFTLPSKIASEFFDFSLPFINNLASLKLILQHLETSETSIKNQIRYQKFELSCKIFETLKDEDAQLWTLSPYPLIILEQLLMNSKIEVLIEIVKNLRKTFDNKPSCNICSNSSKTYQIGETIVYDFDAYHKGKWISHDCVDFLFKIYAAKALDFQIVDINSYHSMSTGTPSSDSLHNKVFQMPKEIPNKDLWVPDDEAALCMCCRKSKFSLLNRRHHCRRCGRVVCAECSRLRILLPEKYNTLMVRCCDDCYKQLEEERKKVESGFVEKARSAIFPIEWKLTGDPVNDQIVRDEFTFEYSPNVGLCIAIICVHTVNEDLTRFLLFHCHRLELLLRPIHGRINPEIDVTLVAKMLKYLATTAKLFGDIGESNVIIDYADIILKITDNECDSIISRLPFNNLVNNISIRDVINELTKTENWKLALEMAVKWDRASASGVFSAWAVSLIKGGQYKLAREKVALALQPVIGSSVNMNEELVNFLSNEADIREVRFSYKRPAKSSPLLFEILEILDTTASRTVVSDDLTASTLSLRLNSPRHDNKGTSQIMESLKKIMEGDYGSTTRRISEKFEWNSSDLLKTPYYEESLYYLITYGGNAEILEFFMKNKLVKLAVRYALVSSVSYDIFIQLVFVPIVKAAKLNDFLEILRHIDETFMFPQNFIIAICKFLQRKKALNILYQMQLKMDDHIRAALTSIKFYLDGSGNYTELNEKSRYLMKAIDHLQMELEKVEHGEKHERGIQLKWDIKTINAQINILLLQLEVSKYLAQCEANGFPTLDVMPKVFMDKISLKTLLGKPNELTQVAILLLICGQSVESAFGLSYRVIQECSLKPSKIYSTCTKYLARDIKRLIEVEKLVNCIRTNAASSINSIDADTEKMCDDLVAMAVEIAYTQHQSEAKIQIDQLIKLITNKTMKIECYINSNQLKTAFVHSAALNNLDFIKRIMKKAEVTRQDKIRRLCEKKLQQSLSDHESMSSKSDITS